jgi:tetratricopeptide (TPR) repeat protein
MVVGLCLSAAIGLQAVRERVAPPTPAVVPTLCLQSPDAARRVMLSFADLAADVYWIRAVVHYGGERRSSKVEGRYALLYPLLDLATTLDPHFDVAARLGAIFLSEGFPGGPGRTDQAIALLEKGLRNDPRRWQYRHDIGFVHYWWIRDYQEAARQFELASQLPDAPLWLRTMAAVTLAKGGDRAGARKLWTELYATADVAWLRRAAENRLQQLQAMDELDAIGAIAGRFIARTGRAPMAWSDLIAAGLLPAVPVDPAGVPYVLEPGVGLTVSPTSPLHPLPSLEAHR